MQWKNSTSVWREESRHSQHLPTLPLLLLLCLLLLSFSAYFRSFFLSFSGCLFLSLSHFPCFLFPFNSPAASSLPLFLSALSLPFPLLPYTLPTRERQIKNQFSFFFNSLILSSSFFLSPSTFQQLQTFDKPTTYLQLIFP